MTEVDPGYQPRPAESLVAEPGPGGCAAALARAIEPAAATTLSGAVDGTR